MQKNEMTKHKKSKC